MESTMHTNESLGSTEPVTPSRSFREKIPGNPDDLIQYASEFATKFKSVSEDAVRESVSFAKKYPIHTALGACAIGFFAGFLAKRS